MIIKNMTELQRLQTVGEAVSITLTEMLHAVRPGITTTSLDQLGGRILKKLGATSAPKSVYHFPGFTCISINDTVAHGIPSNRMIEDGDLVNIDVSAFKDGYYADSGYTVIAGHIVPAKNKLCQCSQHALTSAVQIAQANTSINQIGKTIEGCAKQAGYTVIKNLSGHGIGHHLHEHPFNILNFYRKVDNQKLIAGQVIAIETFVSSGATYVQQVGPWEYKTPPGQYAPQYEQTIVITEHEPIILTPFNI